MLTELITPLLGLLTHAQTIADAMNCVPATPGGPSSCPASAFNLETAALATQGYWLQADVLYHLTEGGLGTWAILIYTIAAVSGIISMAMGFPPKLYLWFFVGPGMYHWLVQDTIPVAGVRWNVGPKVANNIERQRQAQQQVWKNAEPGLAALDMIQSKSYRFEDTLGDLGLDLQFNSGIGKVRVSNLFVWYDTLLSDFVEWVMRWTGVFNLPGAEASIFSSAVSNLPRLKIAGSFNLGSIIGGLNPDSGPSDDMHWLLSNNKWKYIQSVTGAKLSSVQLRDAFLSFISSECGDAFRKGVDEGAYVAAQNARGSNVPDSIFLDESGSGPLSIPTLGRGSQYVLVTKYLASIAIPTPNSFKEFLSKDSMGGFRKGFPFIETEDFQKQNIYETVRCDQFLYLLIHAFRWEAGHMYYQMISGLPAGISPITMMYTLFYGWPRHNLEIENLLSGGIGGLINGWQNIFNSFNPMTLVRELTPDGQAAFFTDLILVHMFRNEFAAAPKPFDVRSSAGQLAIDYSNINQASVGSVSKFAEVYQWAMLMPYVQGVLMYLLAVAYPFVCLFILIPGWHKILYTWMTFWAWVKLWDVGFALCVSLERSIWALVGNNSDAVKLFSKVWSMQQHGVVKVTCPTNLASFGVNPPYGICAPGTIPDVIVNGGGGLLGTGISVPITLPGGGGGAANLISWFDTIQIFDKAMVLAGAMDLDLANSYYIYLMSALYFAVPAVTGQIVLGAKSGAASLATQAIQSSAQESGRAAGAGVTGDLTTRAAANQTTVGQMAYAKAMRNDPNEFGFNALGYGNLGLRSQQEQSAAGALEKGFGNQSRQYSLASQQRVGGINAGKGLSDSVVAASNTGVKSFGEVGKKTAQGFGDLLRAGPAGRAASNGMDTAMSAYGATNMASQIMNGVAGLANYGIESNNRAIQANLEGKQSGQMVAGFTAGGMAAGYNNASQKQSQAAEQRANEAKWSALNSFAGQASGALAAQGVLAGTLSPGQKPTNLEGMAMTGMLGSAMQEQAQYSDPTKGDYSNWFMGLSNDVNSQVGQQSMEAIYASNSGGAMVSEMQGLQQLAGTVGQEALRRQPTADGKGTQYENDPTFFGSIERAGKAAETTALEQYHPEVTPFE